MEDILVIVIIHGFIMMYIKKYVQIQWLSIVFLIAIILRILTLFLFMITWLIKGHCNALKNILNNLLILLIKKCFENCTEAAFYYHYVIEKENSYECIW